MIHFMDIGSESRLSKCKGKESPIIAAETSLCAIASMATEPIHLQSSSSRLQRPLNELRINLYILYCGYLLLLYKVKFTR